MPGLNGPTAPTNVALVPSIVQTAGVPSLPCHRMSERPSPLTSLAAPICQLGPGLKGPTAPTKVVVVPSISQIAGVPSLPCHRMSERPSRLKSPVPLICQLGPGSQPARQHPYRHGGHAVHQPDRSRAVVALPQNVGVAVAVELAARLDLPIRPRIERTGGTEGQHITAVHQPDRGGAIAVLPQNVGLAVAVEVAARLDLPARPRIE